MEKRGLIRFLLIFIFATLVLGLILSLFFFKNLSSNFTGRAVEGPPAGSGGGESIGPSQAEQKCMQDCFTPICGSDMNCRMNNSQKCLQQCSIQKPDPVDEGQSCMETCVLKGCETYDFSCQSNNKAICEKECNMIKEPEAKSEEEQCIRDCVKAIDASLICQAGEGGEKGNEVCQQCAKQCEHLYNGPCLTELKLEEKKKSCQTCEHCFAEPVMGDSGEGYECIVDVTCGDSSSEFGDNPGTGPGVVKNVGEAIGNVVENIVDFFQGIFGGNKEASSGGGEETSPSSE